MQGAIASALVIGAGSGIGRGLAGVLARRGYDIVAGDIDGASAHDTAQRIRDAGGTALGLQVDATDAASLASFAQAASERRVTLLAVTVGAIIDRPLVQASEADWAWMLDLNLMTHVRSVDACLPLLRRVDGHRRILLVASMGGVLEPSPAACGGSHLGLYVASKHALVGYAGVLRHELAIEGIQVGVALPTRVEGNLERTSRTHRPVIHGGPVAMPDVPARTGLMSAEQAAARMVAALDAGHFHLFTDPGATDAIRAHADEMLRAAVLTQRDGGC